MDVIAEVGLGYLGLRLTVTIDNIFATIGHGLSESKLQRDRKNTASVTRIGESLVWGTTKSDACVIAYKSPPTTDCYAGAGDQVWR
jgi:hypothetical protein